MKAIRTLAILALGAAGLVGRASAIDRGISGLWYDPAQTGHGFELTVVSPSTVAVTWYTYNGAGVPIWVAGVLSESSPGVLTGNVSYYDGMRFGQFSPSTNVTYAWGTLRFTFTGCSSGTVQYNGTLRYSDGGGFGAGTIQIQKLAGVQDVTCDQAPTTPSATLAGTYSGFLRSSSGEQLQAFALLEHNGSATIALPGAAVYSGQYNGTSSVSFTLTGLASPGSTFANGSTTTAVSGNGTARSGDYISGTYAGTGDAGQFSFSYLGASSRSASLSTVAGTYTDPGQATTLRATVASGGAITGSDATGCRFTGSMSPLSGMFAFSVSLVITNCGDGNGTYTGKALGATTASMATGEH